ncbi:hypothetical protein GBF38_007128, partial [Nibea albiflora]
CRCVHGVSPGQVGPMCPVHVHALTLVPGCTCTWDTKDSSNNNAPQQEKEAVNPSTDEEKAGVAEQKEEAHEKLQPKDEQAQQQEKAEEEELHGQQNPEAPAAEQVQDHKDPVHMGQPEI